MSQLIQTPTYYLADAKRAAWGDWAHDDRQSRNGGGMNGEPKRQGAALAVLAYFFDSCDIFEDPLVSVEAS